jgi:hypothetical protein
VIKLDAIIPFFILCCRLMIFIILSPVLLLWPVVVSSFCPSVDLLMEVSSILQKKFECPTTIYKFILFNVHLGC